MGMVVPFVIGFRRRKMRKRPWQQEHLAVRKYFGSSGASFPKIWKKIGSERQKCFV
jgi:hypothetical protein